MGDRTEVTRKIHDPEFVWPGKEPDEPDWDDDFPQRLGRGLSGIGSFIVLYVMMPLTVFPAVLLSAVIVWFPILLWSGRETLTPAEQALGFTVGALAGAAWIWFGILRYWRQYGFLRHRWPLSLKQ